MLTGLIVVEALEVLDFYCHKLHSKKLFILFLV